MNNAAVNICIQNLLCMLNSLGFIPRRGNAGSFGNSVLGTAKLFSTSFKFTQQCMWFPNSPHVYQHLLFPILKIIVILVIMKWYHLVVYISLTN